MSQDRVARVLAAIALGCSVAALALAAYAVSREEARGADLEGLAEALERASAARPRVSSPDHAPPPRLDDAEE